MYAVKPGAVKHTCWNAVDWNGSLSPETCKGCAEAVQNPCEFCGYGHVFPSHAPETHQENADTQAPSEGAAAEVVESWSNSPHIYN